MTSKKYRFLILSFFLERANCALNFLGGLFVGFTEWCLVLVLILVFCFVGYWGFLFLVAGMGV